METPSFNDFDNEIPEELDLPETTESSLSKKVERRRRIEDLQEERRLREELEEF